MSQAKERPILFSGPMVRALLDGRKTVTRRALKVQPHIDASGNFCVGNYNYGQDLDGRPVTKHFANEHCPYGQPGDRIWVREAWAADAQLDSIAPRDLGQHEPIYYPADRSIRQTACSMISKGKVRPSIHMPRTASRILLEITAVRVERLQDISEDQAKAEGPDLPVAEHLAAAWGVQFRRLWESINGPEAWAANPWVWVVEFKRIQP